MNHLQTESKNGFRFEKVGEKHIPLLFSWLNSARLKGIYDNGFSSQEQLKAKYLGCAEIQRFIVSSDGAPFGYIQSYPVLPDHEYAEYAKYQGRTIGVDLFIGDPSFLGHGYGFLMLKKFIPFLGREVSRVIADPLIDSPPLRLFEKYGFTKVGQKGDHHILAIDIRYTVRALILNKQRELLLMRIEDHTTRDASRPSDHFWVTIGGTIEKGETEMEALKREIREETGIEEFSVGELAFLWEHTLLVSHFPVRHFEKFYLTYSNQMETHQKNLTKNEQAIFREMRWWLLSDLLLTKEVVYPPCLAFELERAIKKLAAG